MLRTTVLLVALAGCAGSAGKTRPLPASPPGASVAWERARERLPGSWQATTADGAVIRVTYRLVSGDTVLVESFVTPSGRETLTVLHPDGDGLVLTHYCAQGNQPRLRAVEASGDTVVFELADATNLTPDQAVLTRRSLTYTATGFAWREIYRQPDGSDEDTLLTFAPKQ